MKGKRVKAWAWKWNDTGFLDGVEMFGGKPQSPPFGYVNGGKWVRVEIRELPRTKTRRKR